VRARVYLTEEHTRARVRSGLARCTRARTGCKTNTPRDEQSATPSRLHDG